MDKDVWFRVAREGYTYPPDAYGLVGVRIPITEGGSATIAGRTFTSDSAGRVAVYEPDASGHDTIALASHGYASLTLDLTLASTSSW